MKRSKKDEGIDYLDVLDKLEELRQICLYTPRGRVKKNPNVREANRALASAIGALNGLRRRGGENAAGAGLTHMDRIKIDKMPLDDLKERVLERTIALENSEEDSADGSPKNEFGRRG